MSGTVDSLSIKVDASARGANQQLDKLVQKMIELRSTVNGINIGNLNAMAVSIQNFSKAATGLNQVKTSDFSRMTKNIEKLIKVDSSNLDKSAQSVEKVANSMQRASSVSQKVISSGVKFDSSSAQNMQKAIQNLSSQFSDVGKGKIFEGTLAELEKQADKLRKKLDDLAEKEEKILTVGGTSTESRAFKNLQYDISKTMNQLAELENQIRKVSSVDKQDFSSVPIFRHEDMLDADLSESPGLIEFQEKADQVFQKIPESAKYSVETAQQSLQEAIKKAHVGEEDDETENFGLRNYAKEIKELEGTLKGLEQSGKGMGSDEWDEAYIALHKVNMEVKEYKDNLLRPWKEGDEEVRKTNSLGNQVEELNAKLKELKARGLNFGDGKFDEVYRALQRTTGELKEYKAVLNKPATEMDEEVRKTDSLGNKVEELKARLKDLQAKGLNFGDGEFDKTFQALQKSTVELKKYKANLSDTGKTARSVSKGICDTFRSIWNQTKKTGSAVAAFGSKVRSLTTRFHFMSSSTNGLIGKLMKLYIGFHALKSAANVIKNAFDESAEYIESYNYFDDVFSNIAEKSKSGWKDQGYNNAEAYADSFQGRMKTMLSKMTGYDISENGILSSTDTKNLGLDVSQMTQYATSIANLADSIGLAGETSINTSKALSMLVGDLGAFRNMDTDQVMSNLQSGLTGSAQAMKKYGIDISVATLRQIALDNGIKKSVSSMTQAEKVQLRMLAVLSQSRSAWGYLAKEINTPSNQIRLLKNSFNALSRTIGNIFMPVVAKVLPYINGLVIAIKRLFEWSASLLGIDLSDMMGSVGGGSDAFDGLEEDANDASDAVDDTTDSVKKLAKQLMGFDELNVITTNKSNEKDKDKDSASIDLTDELSAALADYEAVWNKAYKNMTSDAEKFANKLTKLFKDAWQSGDGSDIGSAIAGWLNKGISWVNKNVDKFAAGLKKIANMLATGVNGFVEKLDWAGMGTAIGKSLKAFFDAETHFFDTVNWTNLGKSLATSLNSAISTGVLQSYFKLIASKLKAAIETAFGAVTTFDFSGLGAAIGQGINDFFSKMNEVNKETGLNGWQALGKTLSTGISGIATTITTALKTVKWETVGKSIGDFIAAIDFMDVAWNLAKLANSLFDAIVDTVKGFTEKAPLETAIIGLFAGLKLTGIAGKIGRAITTALAGKNLSLGKIAIGIGLGAATLKLANKGEWKSSIASGVTAFLAAKTFTGNTKLSLKIAAVTVAVAAGFSIGKKIGEWLDEQMSTEDMSQYRYDFKFTDLFTYGPSEWAQGIADMIVDCEIDSTIQQMLDDLVKGNYHIQVGSIELPSFNDKVKKVEKGIRDIKNAFGALGADIKKGTFKFKIGSFELPSWNEITTKVKNGINDIKGAFDLLTKDIKSGNFKFKIGAFELPSWNEVSKKASEVWNNLKTWWTTNVKLPKIDLPTIADIKKGVSDAWAKAKNWWSSNVKLPKINLPTIADIKKKIQDIWSKTKSWWNSSVKLPKINLPTIADIQKGVSNAWTKAKNWWNEHVKLPDIKFPTIPNTTVKNWLKPIVTVLNSIIEGFNKLMELKWGDFRIAGKTIVKKGSFTLLTIPTIKGFASGGFPEQGQYFLARENGPELVGTIGGKSAVVNNPQIVQSVSDGVFNALAPVLTLVVNAVNGLQANSSDGQPLYVEGISDGDIVRITTQANTDHKKRYGKPLYA